MFPLIPFLFPMGLFLTLMGLMAWFQYRSWQELTAIRHEAAEGLQVKR